MHNFLSLLKLIAPIALSAIPQTRAAAPYITTAIEAAEETFGPGSGPDKLAHAKELTSVAILTHNAIRPGAPIDHDTAITAFDDAVKTTIDAVKVIQGVKQALPKQQTIDNPTN